MKKFLFKIILISLPILIFLIIPVIVLIRTRENFVDIENYLDRKYLVGYAYNEKNYNYLKWLELKKKDRFQLLALGSSRVLPFRRNMFTKTFYNAGFIVSSITDFIPFLESIPKEKYPNYLIIGLDQWMFNKNWDDFDGDKFTRDWSDSFESIPSCSIIKTVYSDLIEGKYSSEIFNSQSGIFKIGLNAIVNDKGFRNDGSMYYGKTIEKLITCDETTEDFLFKDTHNRINEGKSRFEYGNKVNPLAVEEVSKILDFCKKNKIFVVAFLPPFANEIYLRMQAIKKYQYIDSIYPKIKPFFDEYNFEIHNYSSVAFCNSNDNETLDGFHGGEVTYQKMLIDMAEHRSKLINVIDLEQLKKDLAHPLNDYIVYPY